METDSAVLDLSSEEVTKNIAALADGLASRGVDTADLPDVALPFLAVSQIGAATPDRIPLWVWIQGQWSTRNDLLYRSLDIKAWGWVTTGPNPGDPKYAVDELQVLFGCPCASGNKTWVNEDHNGLHYFAKQKGLPPPGTGFCFPTSVFFRACATAGQHTWCAEVTA